jgi:hypothetical protein
MLKDEWKKIISGPSYHSPIQNLNECQIPFLKIIVATIALIRGSPRICNVCLATKSRFFEISL